MSREVPTESPHAVDVPWLSDDQQRDWRDLVRLLALLPAAIDAQLKRDAALNLYEFQVLAGLSESPGRTLGLSQLADMSQGSPSRLSHALTRLEKAGLVERRACPDQGGRRAEAHLTDAGMAKIVTIAPGHVREARRLVIDVLSGEQLEELGEIARAINSVALLGTASPCTELDAC